MYLYNVSQVNKLLVQIYSLVKEAVELIFNGSSMNKIINIDIEIYKKIKSIKMSLRNLKENNDVKLFYIAKNQMNEINKLMLQYLPLFDEEVPIMSSKNKDFNEYFESANIQIDKFILDINRAHLTSLFEGSNLDDELNLLQI